MKNDLTRRNFLGSCAVAAGTLLASNDLSALSLDRSSADRSSANDVAPIRLGLASYTFRNFSRAQLIGFMKQLKVFALNAKDARDHLPDRKSVV